MQKIKESERLGQTVVVAEVGSARKNALQLKEVKNTLPNRTEPNRTKLNCTKSAYHTPYPSPLSAVIYVGDYKNEWQQKFWSKILAQSNKESAISYPSLWNFS